MSRRTARGSASVRLRSRDADAGLNTQPEFDDLPREQPLSVEINGRHVARLLCMPDAPKELAIGWALAHGFLKERSQVHCVTIHADRVSLMVEALPDGGGAWRRFSETSFDAVPLMLPLEYDVSTDLNHQALASDWRIPRSSFLAVSERAFARFRDDNGEDGFQHAGIGDERMIRCIARDVFRHNAVDKVIGWAFLEEAPPERMILFLSGRMCASIVFKACRAAITVVTASGVPTREAVSLAEARGVTLVGRALEPRPTVYSHAWRLIDGDGVS